VYVLVCACNLLFCYLLSSELVVFVVVDCEQIDQVLRWSCDRIAWIHMCFAAARL
jgi:hypothetical protein